MSHIEFQRTSGAAGVDGKTTVPGLLYGQGAATAHFAIIALQEWWGINGEIKEHAEHLAKSLGCLVLVPDLYRGKVALEVAEAQHLIGTLDWAGAVEDIRSAAAYLLTQPNVKKVGVTGFCMGGALTLLASANCKNVSAGVCFYGIPGSLDASTIKIPVQCHFGEKDGHKGFSDTEAVEKLEEQFKKGWVPYELFTYENAGHAFMNKPVGWYAKMAEQMHNQPYDDAVVHQAWERAFGFFRRHLA